MTNTKDSSITRRQVFFIVAMFALMIIGYSAALVLINVMSAVATAAIVVAALPSIALTTFIPSLSDGSRGFRTLALLTLTVVVVIGQISIGQAISGKGEDPWPSIIVSGIGLVITSAVAYFDWKLPVRKQPETPSKESVNSGSLEQAEAETQSSSASLEAEKHHEASDDQ